MNYSSLSISSPYSHGSMKIVPYISTITAISKSLKYPTDHFPSIFPISPRTSECK